MIWGYVEPDPKHVATLRALLGGLDPTLWRTNSLCCAGPQIECQTRLSDRFSDRMSDTIDTMHVRLNVSFFECQKICQIGMPDRMRKTMPESVRNKMQYAMPGRMSDRI